jgi:glutathione S-transferase
VQSPFVLHAIAAYERAFKLMEQTLAERGPWLLGNEPTLADINMMPFVARLAYLGLLEAWTAQRPRINGWWAQVQEWPSFRRGLHDLISEAEFAEMRTHGPKIRGDVEKLVAGLRRDSAGQQ